MKVVICLTLFVLAVNNYKVAFVKEVNGLDARVENTVSDPNKFSLCRRMCEVAGKPFPSEPASVLPKNFGPDRVSQYNYYSQTTSVNNLAKMLLEYSSDLSDRKDEQSRGSRWKTSYREDRSYRDNRRRTSDREDRRYRESRWRPSDREDRQYRPSRWRPSYREDRPYRESRWRSSDRKDRPYRENRWRSSDREDRRQYRRSKELKSRRDFSNSRSDRSMSRERTYSTRRADDEKKHYGPTKMDNASIVFHYFQNLSSSQISQFEQLGELYNSWNQKMNLISRKDIENLYKHHVLHSLAIARIVTTFVNGSKILDFGTGGGFPGIPLAILFPEVSFYLVDSVAKKITAAEAIVQALGLKNVNCTCVRGEDVDGKYDFILGRAVVKLPEMYDFVKDKFAREQKNHFFNGLLYLTSKSDPPKPENLQWYPLATVFEESYFSEKYLAHAYPVDV